MLSGQSFHCFDRYWEFFRKKDKILTTNPEALTCKICLDSEVSDSDPMINCCLCKGTQAILHLSCCRSWLATKLITFEGK